MHCQPPLHLPYTYVLNEQFYLTKHDKQNYRILILPRPPPDENATFQLLSLQTQVSPVRLRHDNTPTDPHFLLLLGSCHNILLGPSGYTEQDCLFLPLFHSADPQYSQRDPSNLGSPTGPLWHPYSLVRAGQSIPLDVSVPPFILGRSITSSAQVSAFLISPCLKQFSR